MPTIIIIINVQWILTLNIYHGNWLICVTLFNNLNNPQYDRHQDV